LVAPVVGPLIPQSLSLRSKILILPKQRLELLVYPNQRKGIVRPLWFDKYQENLPKIANEIKKAGYDPLDPLSLTKGNMRAA
jgi:hypothetical protein